MPEGDSLARAATRLQALVGERVEVETPHPRAAVKRLVAGIGNLWKAEALGEARVSPWRAVAEVSDEEPRAVLEAAHELMAASVETGRERRLVYNRAGRGCRRCGTPIEARGQGDANRTAYWCPVCQPFPSAAGSGSINRV